MKKILDFLQDYVLQEYKIKARRLIMKAARFTVVERVLLKKSFFRPLLRCVLRREEKEVINAINSGVCGNHSRGRNL